MTNMVLRHSNLASIQMLSPTCAVFPEAVHLVLVSVHLRAASINILGLIAKDLTSLSNSLALLLVVDDLAEVHVHVGQMSRSA